MEEEQALLARERAYADNLERAGKEEEVSCLWDLKNFHASWQTCMPHGTGFMQCLEKTGAWERPK